MNQQLLSIELEDPTSGERIWSLPGGAIEPGETAEEAAVRETLEETGYAVTLTSPVFVNHYLFNWNSKTYECTTHWYRAELISEHQATVDDASYLLRDSWLDWPENRHRFLYNDGLAEAVDHFLPL